MVEIAIAVVTGLISSGAVGTLFVWFIKSNFGNVVKIAVITQRMDRMEADLKEVKQEMGEIKTNYNAKFKETREHVTNEVDRVVDVLTETKDELSKINTRCLVFHPELVE